MWNKKASKHESHSDVFCFSFQFPHAFISCCCWFFFTSSNNSHFYFNKRIISHERNSSSYICDVNKVIFGMQGDDKKNIILNVFYFNCRLKNTKIILKKKFADLNHPIFHLGLYTKKMHYLSIICHSSGQFDLCVRACV